MLDMENPDAGGAGVFGKSVAADDNSKNTRPLTDIQAERLRLRHPLTPSVARVLALACYGRAAG